MVLAGIAHVGGVDKFLVQEAIRAVSYSQIDKWVQANVGETVHAKRCEVLGKYKKKSQLQLHINSTEVEQELTGVFTEKVVGF